MSRSYRKNSIFGITTSESEKEDKRIMNRKFRKKEHSIISKLDSENEELVFPNKMDEICSKYFGSKDGKQYWKPDKSDVEKYNNWKKIMRK